MSCPKCGSHDWKFASVVHANGLSTVETSTVGVGVGAEADVFGGGVGGGVGVARGSGTQQTELSKLAAPPIKVTRPAAVIAWIAAAAMVIVLFLGGSGTAFLGAMAILILSIGRLAGTPQISKEIDEKHKFAMCEYATKKMCLRCGTLFYKEDNESHVSQESQLSSAANMAIDNVINRVNTKQCPYCAETIKAEAVLCKHCHSKL